MKIIPYLNRIIEFSFYSLFLLVPLIFSGSTSELFEFPKMWLTFGITILIGGAWITKMILEKKIFIQRTPLDIPLLLFLASQAISTIFSIDPHVSLWGYYSRFNGGLLSIFSYLFLYYAFVSNLSLNHVLNTLKVSLASGMAVAIWGLPSHFGWDPTCYLFRGTFDTSCWTEAFKPTIRIFSTLGQPAWMAAYMSVLIPILIAYFFKNLTSKSISPLKNHESRIKNYGPEKNNLSLTSCFLLLASLLFYACLTYTDTRGGFIGFWIANLVFWVIMLIKSRHSGPSVLSSGSKDLSRISKHDHQSDSGVATLPRMTITKYFLIFNLLFLLFNFFQGLPISQISKFTLPELSKNILSSNSQAPSPIPAAGALGGTDSGKIRLLVWRGAIDAWGAQPIIGTGVETFAFAYYKYRPPEHNLTSEWDYLYNKAHNEYLNYLATTGILGLGSYLSVIGTFLFLSFKKIKTHILSTETKTKSLNQSNVFSQDDTIILILALISGYISILVSNFFGFSVVIINLYFFLIPAFVFVLGGFLNPNKTINKTFGSPAAAAFDAGSSKISKKQWAMLVVLSLISYLLSLNIISYWDADISYSLGSNLDKAGSYQEAVVPLQNAVLIKPWEPVYTDELAINLGTLSSAFYAHKDASTGAQFSEQAILLSDQVVGNHPNNIVYWKNRVRLFYTLAKGDTAHEKDYYEKALIAIEKARELAPNDAKISYNYGVLAGQINGPEEGIESLEKTIQLKPDYKDAYFALGLYYYELATDQNGNIIDPAMQKKAVQAYEYILKYIDPTDKQIKETLKTWQK